MSAELETQLEQVDTNEHVSAIVYFYAQSDIKAMDALLRMQGATRAVRHRTVIDELRMVADVAQAPILKQLDSLVQHGAVSGYTAYWIVNAVVVAGNRSAIQTLASRDDVQWVDLNFRARLIEPRAGQVSRSLDENHGVPTGIRAIGAKRVWNELGITGAGRLVGNIDTGVDGGHPALAARWRGLFAPAIECWLPAVGVSQFPEDDEGHGTHVMGTICGNSTVSNDSIGVAPGARWIASNAIGQAGGNAFNNDILASFEWMSDPDGNSATIDDVPDVVQNSWGVDGRFNGYQDCFQLWNNAILNCEAAGVVVVFSAGNEGPNARTLRSPATIQIDSVTVFAVGAVDADADTVPPYSAPVFSSRGPSDCEPLNAIKPEVCAPGVDVYSAFPNVSYGRLSGTSMAGPHVAGVVALMREANPNADVREIKSVLMRTAEDFGPGGEENTYGFGFINAYEAVVEIMSNRGILYGRITDANSGNPIHLAEVTAGTRMRRTDEDGHYRLSLPADCTWTVVVSAYGYESASEPLFVPVADSLVHDVELNPFPQGTLHGTVRVGENVAAAGAILSFTDAPLPPVTANASGEFSVLVPGDSTYLVRFTFLSVTRDTLVTVPTAGITDLAVHFGGTLCIPQGPDGFGYHAYDRWDNGIPPAFDWVEIAPAREGPGIEVSLEARDSSAFVAMPFPFRYYGISYDSLTINENGWLAAGVSHDHSFFNSGIPSFAGPSAMIALFWDNLQWTQDSSEICWWYDESNCRLIVEYLNLSYSQAPASKFTAQVHIYDSQHWITPLGDSEILLLYERMDVLNSSTVGIENHSETLGLELLWGGQHNTRTWDIRPGAAILFTTRTQPRTYGSLSGSVIGHPALADYSAATIRVSCSVVNAQTNGGFVLDSIFSGNRNVEFVLPRYETFSGTIRISADSMSLLSVEVWRLDPPRNLAGAISLDSVRLQWNPPESSGSLDELTEYAVFRDNAEVGRTTDTAFTEAIPAIAVFDYYLRAIYDGGTSDTSNHVRVDATVDANDGAAIAPRVFALGPPVPNPFNARTEFLLELPQESVVDIRVYDVTGRLATTIAHGSFGAGVHSFSWDAASQASGLYFLSVDAGPNRWASKLLLLK